MIPKTREPLLETPRIWTNGACKATRTIPRTGSPVFLSPNDLEAFHLSLQRTTWAVYSPFTGRPCSSRGALPRAVTMVSSGRTTLAP